jgi:ubiquinone/menaquinone biosynthesis C-methylase UbiE
MSETYKNKDAAAHYNFARSMPDETLALWMEKLLEVVPRDAVSSVLDLGGGTGRFAGWLQKTYGCPVMVIDPSEEMLEQGRNRGLLNITWQCGVAEDLPLENGSIDLVWMCQVFHHLENRHKAMKEVYRALHLDGYLAVRNGTRENDEEVMWMQCFPEAMRLEEERIPFRADIADAICRYGFRLINQQTISQLFASSYAEYFEKISKRGLSVLISLDDAAFNAGIVRLRKWIAAQPPNQPVYEPVDLFVFRKESTIA